MAKDSQIDPKDVRERKANGGPTSAQSAFDNQTHNAKRQSGNRHQPGDDKK